MLENIFSGESLKLSYQNVQEDITKFLNVLHGKNFFRFVVYYS